MRVLYIYTKHTLSYIYLKKTIFLFQTFSFVLSDLFVPSENIHEKCNKLIRNMITKKKDKEKFVNKCTNIDRKVVGDILGILFLPSVVWK